LIVIKKKKDAPSAGGAYDSDPLSVKKKRKNKNNNTKNTRKKKNNNTKNKKNEKKKKKKDRLTEWYRRHRLGGRGDEWLLTPRSRPPAVPIGKRGVRESGLWGVGDRGSEMCSGSEAGSYLRLMDFFVSLNSRLESNKEERREEPCVCRELFGREIHQIH